MYRMIAVDMDGTLLNNACEITPETASAVREAIERGVLFTISTGRPVQGVERYTRQLSLRAPVITYNGAMIVDSGTGEILYEQGLERKDAQKILALGRARGTTMCIWSRNRLYGCPLNARVYDYRKISDVEPLAFEEEETILQDGITKILWYDDADAVARFQQEMQEEPFDSVTCCRSKPVFLEFFNRRVSKALAMEKIGALYGIKQEEMIAVGDGENDLSMIEYAGLGVAMENASPSVREKAQYVTSSNEENGVAKVIRTFLLTQ